MRFHLRSAAKVNLTLDILSRRADGYHELASVVHTIGLWDDIDIEFWERSHVAFSCNRADLSGEDNLCVQAVQKWNKATGESWGAKIHLEKRIPSGAGLGGGSGNAAAILLACQKVAKAPLSESQLRKVAAQLGADVPLFLDGSAVLMEGIGERLTSLEAISSGWLLVIKPQISLSTPAVYRAWDDNQFESANDTPRLLKLWPSRDLKQIGASLGNDLERAVALMTDTATHLVALLRNSGAIGAQMSGSGSACFGLFASEAAANAARQELNLSLAKDVHLRDAEQFVVPFCKHGVQFALK